MKEGSTLDYIGWELFKTTIMLNLTLEELRYLLDQQKELVIERLIHGTAYYNKESTDGQLKSINNIDAEKFKSIGMEAKYPSDYNVLVRYLK